MPADNLFALENSSLIFPATIAGYTLRPINATSVLILQRTGNKILRSVVDTGNAAPAAQFDVNDAETLFALFAFIYIHAAPLEEVIRASRRPREDFEFAVDMFASGIPLEEVLAMNEHVTSEAVITAAATFEAEPPPTDEPPSVYDPNA